MESTDYNTSVIALILHSVLQGICFSGAITMDSWSGAGTTFAIYLPATDDRPSEKAVKL